MSGACADDRGEKRFGPWRQADAPAMDADLAAGSHSGGGDIAYNRRGRWLQAELLPVVLKTLPVTM